MKWNLETRLQWGSGLKSIDESCCINLHNLFANYISTKLRGQRKKIQKEDLKANKTLSLLCLCDFNGLHVKSTVMGNGVKE